MHKLHRYNQHPTPICPRCSISIETNLHLLHCQWTADANFKTKQITALRTILTGTPPNHDTTLADTVITEIDHWMRGLAPPDIDHLLHQDSTTYLHAGISTQYTIGWDNFFRARLAHAWSLCQPDGAKISSTAWISKITCWIWDFFFDCWHSRNLLLFGDTPQSNRHIHIIRLEAKIRETYNACNALPLAHRTHHQFVPLQRLLQLQPATLTMWLTQATQTLIQHRKAINKGTSQQLITRYFNPVPTIPSEP